MVEITLKHPWQNGPAELIRYALVHANRNTDFDQRIEFLLFDIGIETLFKTFLQLPQDITETKISYSKRKEASEGNFHDVVAGVKAAGEHLLNGADLSHVLFYHDLRNKLYHQGNGITIPTENVQAYAKISVDLLSKLLKVDLSEELLRPEIEKLQMIGQKTVINEINELKTDLKKSKSQLDELVLSVIENVDPALALPSFIKSLSDWQLDVENRINKWLQISHINNEETEQDENGMVVPPLEIIDELINKAPSALKNFRDNYRIKKLYLLRAAIYHETMEFLLLLILIRYDLPIYDGAISFDLSLYLQTNPENLPFDLLEQNEFNSQEALKQLFLDGHKLRKKIVSSIETLNKITT